ncbi:MAG: calcium-binding protein, partial [Rhodobacteraceae bacterium]|nr:calcium-binding protein [Paracoccaceae bacterium]
SDTLDGGAGDRDMADYRDSDASVTVNLAAGTASGGHAEGDVLRNIEYLSGSRHDDTLTGDDGNNALSGGAGNDVLRGGAGNWDWLEGGAGSDTLDGGAGRGDTASYAGSDAAVTVNLATGTARGGHAEGDVLRNIERLRGSNHNDTLTGDDGRNDLWGGAGADTLDGGAGDRDMADYRDSDASVTVNLAAGTASGGHAEGDVLRNIERLRGSDHNDTLTGDDGDNLLRASAGSDTLDGMGGDGDTVAYWDSDAGVTVNLAAGTTSGGHAEGDVLRNIEHLDGSDHDDTLIGDDGDNDLNGGAGADTLNGGAGADTLDGGAGNDRFTGDAGEDTFRFVYDGGGADTVTDFNDGQDTVILDRDEFADIAAVAAAFVVVDADTLRLNRPGDGNSITFLIEDHEFTLEDLAAQLVSAGIGDVFELA